MADYYYCPNCDDCRNWHAMAIVGNAAILLEEFELITKQF